MSPWCQVLQGRYSSTAPLISTQLLVPHIRYTMEINTRSRTQLISDGGIFDQVREVWSHLISQLPLIVWTFGKSCPSMYITINLGTPPLSPLEPCLSMSPSIHQDLSTLLPQVVSTGGGGHVQLLTRAMAQLTYRSLCPPDDLANRGLLRIPSALYARDALELWEVTAR